MTGTSFEEVRVCASPIFVVGSPRSGTTMLGWSLAHHSLLWTSGEANVIQGIFKERAVEAVLEHARVHGKGAWLTHQQVDRAELLRNLGLGVNALYTSRSGDKRWLDHTPANTLAIDLLGELFPRAVFLHMLRDGRQVVSSMVNFLSAMPEDRRAAFDEAGWDIPWLDFNVACETWRDNVEKATAFTERNPERCLTVVHGRLVADPAEIYTAIFEFLGVPYEQAPVNYASSRRVNTSFPDQERESSAGEFATPWDEWSDEQRRTFADIAGETMVRCGLATEDELNVQRQPVL